MRGRLRAAFRARALYFSLHPQVIRDHQAAFEALRNPDLQNFMLFPFFVDGKARKKGLPEVDVEKPPRRG
jgi:hypothetical protein